MASKTFKKTKYDKVLQTYGFPTSSSAISGGNDKFTCGHDGICTVNYTFNDSNYSQFALLLNGAQIHRGMISNGANTQGFAAMTSFPVKAYDIVQVSFYQNFGMKNIELTLVGAGQNQD